MSPAATWRHTGRPTLIYSSRPRWSRVSGFLACLLRARLDLLLDNRRIAHQAPVFISRRFDVLVEVFKQYLLHLAPRDAVGIALFDLACFIRGCECPENVEQGAAVGVFGLAGFQAVRLDLQDQFSELLLGRE